LPASTARPSTVYRFAFSIAGDPDSAEDIAAETYLRAWKARESCRAGGEPVSWLLAITHNCAVDLLRSRREQVALDSIADPEDPGCDETSALSETDVDLIHHAIRRLTPEQQQVIFLRFYEEMPHDTVAARLGRTPNAVRALQFRALSRLKRILEESVVR
jgi:RNA polymerase sigma-70 factor (ECF subfamily)